MYQGFLRSLGSLQGTFMRELESLSTEPIPWHVSGVTKTISIPFFSMLFPSSHFQNNHAACHLVRLQVRDYELLHSKILP
jgi:hypothetical protein